MRGRSCKSRTGDGGSGTARPPVPVSISNRIAATAKGVSEASSRISLRTLPSRRNSSALRNRFQFSSLNCLTCRQGIEPSGPPQCRGVLRFNDTGFGRSFPHSLRRSFDLPIPDMGVAQSHADIAVAKQASDDRQRHTVKHSQAGDGMAEVVQTDILNARLAPHQIPEPKVTASGPSRVPDGREDPRAVSPLHPPLDDFPRRGIQQDGSRTGLAVAEFEPVVLHLVPTQAHDLVLSASGEQQQTDDVGLL